MRMAKQLEALNVDVIEAGFPIASEGDFEAVREISKSVKGCTIAASRGRRRQTSIVRSRRSSTLPNPAYTLSSPRATFTSSIN